MLTHITRFPKLPVNGWQATILICLSFPDTSNHFSEANNVMVFSRLWILFYHAMRINEPHNKLKNYQRNGNLHVGSGKGAFDLRGYTLIVVDNSVSNLHKMHELEIS